jgi:hypothetical protein
MLGHQAASAPSGPYGAHTYWKLEIDANNGHASNTSFSEFKFYDQSSSQIATSGGTAFSGGSGSDTSAVSNLFDGNTGTTWDRSSATNTNVGYQFTSAQAVASIDIITTTATARAPKTCRLRYSDDGSTYTTAFEIYEPSWPASGNATRTWPQDYTGGKYKMLRIYITAGNGDRFVYPSELEFRATVGGSDQANGGVSFASDQPTVVDAAAALFDNNTSSGYAIDTASTALPQSIAYAFPNTVVCAQYAISCDSANSRCPKDFKLQGSNDNSSWTDLNSQSGVTGWSVPETKTFNV